MKPRAPIDPNEDRLQLLAAFHFVLGGILALIGMICCASFAFVLMEYKAPADRDIGFAGVTLFMFMTMALFTLLALGILLAGRSLVKRRNHKFICWMAYLECLCVPFGTVLGIITLSVLQREAVKGIFNSHSPTPPPMPGAEPEDKWEY